MKRILMIAALVLAACEKPSVAPGLDQFVCDGGVCGAPGVIQGDRKSVV